LKSKLNAVSLDRNEVILIISDLHLGDGTGSDDFSYSDFRKLKNADKELIKFIEGIAPDRIVLAGDIFELWQHRLAWVKRAHKELLQFFTNRKAIFIEGNHDIGIGYEDHLVINTPEAKQIFIVHGHQAESYMTNPLIKLGVFLLSFLEKIWPNIDKLYYIVKDSKTESPAVAKYISSQLAKYDIVVLGHTHKGLVRGNYGNAGTCQWGNLEAIKLRTDNLSLEFIKTRESK